MILITASRPYNIKSFIKDIAIFIAIVLAIYLIVALWQQKPFSSYSWFVPIVLFLFHVYNLLDKRILLNIKFDDTLHQIIIQYKTLLSKADEKRIPFETARIETAFGRSIHYPKTMYFLRGKTEIYELKSQGELSPEQLTEIIEAAQKLHIPIERV
jgi:hypothetical protein